MKLAELDREGLEAYAGELEARVESLEIRLRVEWKLSSHYRGEHTTKVPGCWPCVRERMIREGIVEAEEGS
jgi:hypothetical protein